MNLIEQLSQSLFWETDSKTLDAEKNKFYLIPRVMDYGTLEDVRAVVSYYGLDEIKKVLTTVPYLDKRTISFFAHLFNCDKKDFRAHRRKEKWQTWK